MPPSRAVLDRGTEDLLLSIAAFTCICLDAAATPPILHGNGEKRQNFPTMLIAQAWASNHKLLSAAECQRIVAETEIFLRERYGFTAQQISPWETRTACEYPMVITPQQSAGRCSECGDQSFGVCYLE